MVQNPSDQYVDMIMGCVRSNDAESIVLNRVRIVQYNDRALSDKINNSPTLEEGLTTALALATTRNYIACMLVLFEPVRAQEVLKRALTMSPKPAGPKVLKKLLDLYPTDADFQQRLTAINALPQDYPAVATVSHQLQVFVSGVQQSLERYDQKQKLQRATFDAQPCARPSKKL